MSSLPPYKGCSSRCCRTGWSLSPSPSSSPPRTSVSRPRARSTLNVKRQFWLKFLPPPTIESDNQRCFLSYCSSEEVAQSLKVCKFIPFIQATEELPLNWNLIAMLNSLWQVAAAKKCNKFLLHQMHQMTSRMNEIFILWTWDTWASSATSTSHFYEEKNKKINKNCEENKLKIRKLNKRDENKRDRKTIT